MTTTESKVQGFLENNRKFAETWPTPPTMDQLRAFSAENGGGLIILTCLDPRVVPEQFFGPELNAAVIRNAGGRVSQDVIKSITVLHCGVTHLTEDQIREDVRKRTPDAVGEIPDTPYGTLVAADFEKFIKVDVEALRASKIVAGVEIRGLALETETGVVRELQI